VRKNVGKEKTAGVPDARPVKGSRSVGANKSHWVGLKTWGVPYQGIKGTRAKKKKEKNFGKVNENSSKKQKQTGQENWEVMGGNSLR